MFSDIQIKIILKPLSTVELFYMVYILFLNPEKNYDMCN